MTATLPILNSSFTSSDNDYKMFFELPKKYKYFTFSVNITADKINKIELIDENMPSVFMIGITNGETFTGMLKFPNPMKTIRLDPTEMAGQFTINQFRIVGITSFEYYSKKPFVLISKVLLLIKKRPRIVAKLCFEMIKFISLSQREALLSFIRGPKSFIRNLKSEQHNLFLGNHYTYKQPIHDPYYQFHTQPLISIVMPTYNIDPQWLEKAINSVKQQWYENWELCICDDGSTNASTIEYLSKLSNKKIKIHFLEANAGISAATNMAISMATGDYIAFMDNDDELCIDALYEIVNAINVNDADFIYSDEDFIHNSHYINPHYKPDFNYDLLLSHNYITHLVSVKRSLLDRVGLLRSEFDGAQDYDFVLRATEVAKSIVHIPKVLYHWRIIETSTTFSSETKPKAHDNGKKALYSALQRRSIKGHVLDANSNFYYRVKRNIDYSQKVSIIIPFKDMAEMLENCILSILSKSTYQNYEIIGISNNSEKKETFETIQQLKTLDQRVKFFEYNVPFNYSHINNYAVNQYASGEHILLLNNDTEVINVDWLESLLEHSQRDDVGAVGGKLLFEDNTIQHAGVVIGIGGFAGHAFKGQQKDSHGYFNRAQVIQNYSAVTAACLMVKTELFRKLGGLNEEDLAIAGNDVDFCLRLLEAGYRNIYTPYCEMYHYESKSRGYEESPEKMVRFEKEKSFFSSRHKSILDHGDPNYNKNLTLIRENFNLI